MESLSYDYIIDNSKVMQLPDIFHSIRVAKLSAMLCDKMGIKQKEKEEIVVSAALHDIGKSMVSRSILNKPGKLNNREWSYIKLHPEYGAELTAKIGLSPRISKNILYHHEDYSGSGYPKKAKGRSIPLGACIVRVCDSYDAMRTKRPYKVGFTHDEAIKELINKRQNYCSKVLEKFITLDFLKVNSIYECDI